MSITLTHAAVTAAELRKFLKDDPAETIIYSKKDVRKLLDIIDGKIATAFGELTYQEKDAVNSLVTVELMKQGIMTQEMPVQPEVTPASEACPEPHLWSCYDGVATEVEVLEFLYSLVRLLKPKFILETGTYLGFGAVHMALAQKKNGFGDLLTCDTDEVVLQKAITLALANDVEKHMQFVKRMGVEVIPQLDDRCLDMAFIDSGDVDTRKQEIKLIISKLKKGAICVVHDINTYPEIEHFIYNRDDTCSWVFDETPRGLCLFTKI